MKEKYGKRSVGGNMNLYPKLYLNNVTEITVQMLNQYQIKGIILDVDNTLIDYDKLLIEGLEKWIDKIKKEKMKLCIVSNSNDKNKVETIAKKLDIPYFYLAMKPLKGGFKKAQELLQLESKNIAVVGDQILTDVWGANRCNMFSILVKPINEKDIFITKIKRPLENKIIEKIEKQQRKRRK